MGYRQDSFAPDEWYHCYTRSVERSSNARNVFAEDADCERFLEAFHLANSATPIRRSDLYKPKHLDILSMPRENPLVVLGAYNILPTHFHLLLKELVEGGISKIMQTVGTSFSMYYNLKYKHIGNVFVKPFRSKYIENDRYFKHVVNYIHLNSAEIYEPGWKEGRINNLVNLERSLLSYRFSSLPDYQGIKRPQRSLLDVETMSLIANTDQSLLEIIKETSDFYKEYEEDF